LRKRREKQRAHVPAFEGTLQKKQHENREFTKERAALAVELSRRAEIGDDAANGALAEKNGGCWIIE
jgi:hypothetical protein